MNHAVTTTPETPESGQTERVTEPPQDTSNSNDTTITAPSPISPNDQTQSTETEAAAVRDGESNERKQQNDTREDQRDAPEQEQRNGNNGNNQNRNQNQRNTNGLNPQNGGSQNQRNQRNQRNGNDQNQRNTNGTNPSLGTSQNQQNQQNQRNGQNQRNQQNSNGMNQNGRGMNPNHQGMHQNLSGNQRDQNGRNGQCGNGRDQNLGMMNLNLNGMMNPPRNQMTNQNGMTGNGQYSGYHNGWNGQFPPYPYPPPHGGHGAPYHWGYAYLPQPPYPPNSYPPQHSDNRMGPPSFMNMPLFAPQSQQRHSGTIPEQTQNSTDSTNLSMSQRTPTQQSREQDGNSSGAATTTSESVESANGSAAEPVENTAERLERETALLAQDGVYRFVNFQKRTMQPSSVRAHSHYAARKSYYRDLMALLADPTGCVLLKVKNTEILREKVAKLKELADLAPEMPDETQLEEEEWRANFVLFVKEMTNEVDEKGQRARRDAWIASSDWKDTEEYYQAVEQEDWSVPELMDRLEQLHSSGEPTGGGAESNDDRGVTATTHTTGTRTEQGMGAETRRTSESGSILQTPRGRGSEQQHHAVSVGNQQGQRGQHPPQSERVVPINNDTTSTAQRGERGADRFRLSEASIPQLNKEDFQEAVQKELAPFIEKGMRIPNMLRQTLATEMAREILYFQWAPNDFVKEWEAVFGVNASDKEYGTNVERAMGHGQQALKSGGYINAAGERLKKWRPYLEKRSESVIDMVMNFYPVKPATTRRAGEAAFVMPPPKRARLNDGRSAGRGGQEARQPLEPRYMNTTQRVGNWGEGGGHRAGQRHRDQGHLTRNLQELMQVSTSTGPEFAAEALHAYGVDREAKLSPFIMRTAEVIECEQVEPLAAKMLKLMNNKDTYNPQKVMEIQGMYIVTICTIFR